jgi:tetratricopeptide (TPR) repeat protein
VAYARLGRLLYRENRKSEARTCLERAVKLDPEDALSWFYIGKCKRDAGDYPGALAALELSQKSPEVRKRALVERGGTYMGMKSFERAIVELERAVRLPGPEGDAEALYGRWFLSLAYEQTRQLDKAIEQWERIAQVKPAFEKVAHKLQQYEQVRADDRVKDYVTVGRKEFLEVCQQAVRAMGLGVGEAAEIPNGCEVVATESEGKGRSARKTPRLIWFLRVPEMIGDKQVRAMAEQMRKARIARGAIYASSGFSRPAQEFAENRPIELHGREGLQQVLAGQAGGRS